MVSETQNETGRLRLLLVDDEAGFTTIMAKRLTRRDMVVTTAFSGTQGIQALRTKRFDVAVLDLKMEDMDGIEVLKIFKIMDPNMPVIMLTGHGSEKSANDGIQHGAYDYLTKPYEFTELLEKIRQAVSSKKK
jgi:DNA-binding NtrC family response regulator